MSIQKKMFYISLMYTMMLGTALAASDSPTTPMPSKAKVHVCPAYFPVERGWIGASVYDPHKAPGWNFYTGSDEPRQIRFQSVKYEHNRDGTLARVSCMYEDKGGIAAMFDRKVPLNCAITSSNTVTCP